MLFDFFLNRKPTPAAEFLMIGQVPMVLVRNPRARRYVLRLRPDGVARVTIPRGGSQDEARRFAERNRPWLEQQVQKLVARPKTQKQWLVGTEILLRGEGAKIEAGTNGETGMVRLGPELIRGTTSTPITALPLSGISGSWPRKNFPRAFSSSRPRSNCRFDV